MKRPQNEYDFLDMKNKPQRKRNFRIWKLTNLLLRTHKKCFTFRPTVGLPALHSLPTTHTWNMITTLTGLIEQDVTFLTACLLDKHFFDNTRSKVKPLAIEIYYARSSPFNISLLHSIEKHCVPCALWLKK